MDSRHFIARHEVVLPDDIMDRYTFFGCAVVTAYRNGDNDQLRSVSSHGAEENAHLQAVSRMAECATSARNSGGGYHEHNNDRREVTAARVQRRGEARTAERT